MSMILIVVCLLFCPTFSQCSPSHFSRVICITPTINEVKQNELENEGSCHSNYTLGQVLHNYTRFFTSNTNLQLLPGTHEVSEPIGNIVVRDVHNFTMIGVIRNNSLTQRCGKIECVGNGLLGFSFIRTSYVTISNICITNCSATVTYIWNDEFIQICGQTYTLITEESSFINIEKSSFTHSNETCLVAQGMNTFTLHQCIIQAHLLLESQYWCYACSSLSVWEKYRLSDLLLMPIPELKDKSKPLLFMEFHHAQASARIVIENVTVKHGNILLNHKNAECDQEFTHTYIKIYNLTLIGSDEFCYAMKIVKDNMAITCIHNRISFKNSHFIRSSFSEITKEIGCGSRKLYNKEVDLLKKGESRGHFRGYVIDMEQVVFENVPCKCPAAMKITCLDLRLKSYSIVNSCCSGEALIELNQVSVSLSGSNWFLENKRTCISSTNETTLYTYGNTTFSRNVAEEYSGSTITIMNSALFVSKQDSEQVPSVLTFTNNTGKRCGGMIARANAKIIFWCPTMIQFINNRGYDGGALALYDGSEFLYSYCELEEGEMQFIGNSALHIGGAIYIDDEGYKTLSSTWLVTYASCAFVSFINPTKRVSVHSGSGSVTAIPMTFENNSAKYSGSAIFGGWIDICDHNRYLNLNINANSDDLSVVSSYPSRVCICINSTPQCNITDYEINPLFPGQSFQIEAVAVGQRFGTMPSVVSAAFVNATISVDELQIVQIVDKFCTKLNYTVRSPNQIETLILTVERRYVPDVPIQNSSLNSMALQQQYVTSLLLRNLTVRIPLLTCPLGFRFNQNSKTCVCSAELRQQNVQCNFRSYSIHRRKNQWINSTFEHINSIKDHGVLVHNHCPLDYCISRDQSLQLESPSDQCNYNRSGILCGSCQGNLSQIFGTNRCKECSSMWVLLITPVLLLLGLALVVFIIILNLTVAQGTVNALIFYANIVSASQSTFFTTETTKTFFRWFIAWLNLDLGIETCYISGLDAYTKTWLQFLFPIYIWLLVILIIVASRYSTLAAKLSGENAVPALATLFLLSYTKLLRVTITIFSSTHLEYPNGYIRRVWLFDGTIDFLGPSHAILFTAALLLLVVISVPYTLVLLTIQWLQRLPYHCLLSWVWKLKPLFDAHTGPYKEKHRYWPGLLLLVRVVVYVVLSLNVKNNPALNLLVTSATSFGLLIYLAYLGGLHREHYLDIVEYLLLLNLGILSVATFYTRLGEGNQDGVIKASVGFSVVAFLFIILSHIYLKLTSFHKGAQCLEIILTKVKALRAPLINVLSRIGIIKVMLSTNTRTVINPRNNVASHTHLSIELREPLMAQ